MSRQGDEPESQMVLKRPRREDQLAPRLHPTSISTSMVPRIQGIDLMPTIRGVHEHMSTWMSSLINAQDGCLQAVAHRASMGRSHQEHLAQQVAMRSTMPSTTNQVAYLRAQLALRDAQIEQVKAQKGQPLCPRRRSISPYASTQQRSQRLEIQGSDGSRRSAMSRKCPDGTSSYRSTRGHGSTLQS